MRNLSTFINAGGKAEWKYLIFEHNKHQVDDAKQLAKSLGVETFISEPLTNWSAVNWSAIYRTG